MEIENLINDLKGKQIEKASVLAYFYNKVCIGKYENSEIKFNENVDYNLLTQIRVFNDKIEIRYVLNDETGEFEDAIIEDNDNSDYLDEYMMVSGDDSKRLIVRNYFEEEKDNHQVVISKSRLVGFTTNVGGEHIES